MAYNIDSIETLPFKDAVRRRIQMYLGSNDMEGVYNGLQEIISNSIDEFIMGYGDKIEITLMEDNTVSVRDYGRGVPFGTKEDGTNTLQAIYSSPHTGGKFNDKAYQFAVGLNGIGAKATCLSSEFFNVVSVRDGKKAAAVFEKGNFISYQEVDNDTNTAVGTFVKYKPDAGVFNLEPINIEYNRICESCKNLSYLTEGLKFVVENKVTGEKNEYKSDEGLKDLVKEFANSPIHKDILDYSMSDGTNSIEIALQWTKGRERSFCFTNGVLNAEGGTPITGIKTSITRNLNKHFKSNLTGELARTGLVYAINCKVANPSFANQTKTKINNPELRSLADKAFSEAFANFTNLYPDQTKKIEDFLLREKKAEEAAERARKQVLEATKDIEKNQKKKVFASDKLKDAKNLGEDSILLIVEGNSAAAAMAAARDPNRYGILGIKGKILNCLAHPEEKIFQNEEIKLLLSAMNIIPGRYNPKKLRYGKIAICTDADSDGYHIGLLIMAALRYLAPDFLNENRLCWLRSPLFIVKNGKKESFYYTDEEFNAAKPKGEVTRAKGLGALNAERAHASMFTEEYQRLDVLQPDPAAIILLEELMGEDVEPRREFIFNNIDFSEVRE